LVSESGGANSHVLGDGAEGDQGKDLTVKWSAGVGSIAKEKDVLVRQVKLEAVMIVCRGC
jgi:hypothetical protein